MYVTLTTARVVRAPLTENLRAATAKQRAAGYVTAFGTELRWDEIDEDVGVAHVLGVSEGVLYDLAGFTRGLPPK